MAELWVDATEEKSTANDYRIAQGFDCGKTIVDLTYRQGACKRSIGAPCLEAGRIVSPNVDQLISYRCDQCGRIADAGAGERGRSCRSSIRDHYGWRVGCVVTCSKEHLPTGNSEIAWVCRSSWLDEHKDPRCPIRTPDTKFRVVSIPGGKIHHPIKVYARAVPDDIAADQDRCIGHIDPVKIAARCSLCKKVDLIALHGKRIWIDQIGNRYGRTIRAHAPPQLRHIVNG